MVEIPNEFGCVNVNCAVRPVLLTNFYMGITDCPCPVGSRKAARGLTSNLESEKISKTCHDSMWDSLLLSWLTSYFGNTDLVTEKTSPREAGLPISTGSDLEGC